MTKCGFCNAEGIHTIRNCDSARIEQLINIFVQKVVSTNWMKVYIYLNELTLKNVKMISIKRGGNATGNKASLVKYIMNNTYMYIPGAPWYEPEDQDIVAFQIFEIWKEWSLEDDVHVRRKFERILDGYSDGLINGTMRDVYLKYKAIVIAYRLTQYTPAETLAREQQERERAERYAHLEAERVRIAAEREVQRAAEVEEIVRRLTQEQLEELPQEQVTKITIKSISCNIKTLNNKMECSVCLEDCAIKTMARIDCNHEFCINCISSTFRSNALQNNCALCREPIRIIKVRGENNCKLLHAKIIA